MSAPIFDEGDGPPRPMSSERLQDELVRMNNEMLTAQRELVRKGRDLAKLSEEKTRLLRMLAHDIRNPLGVILGFSDHLETVVGPALGEEVRTILAHIHRASQFIVGMLDDYLDLSRIEAGEAPPQLEETDLRELVEENVAMNRALAAPKRIRLEVVPGDPLPSIHLDRRRTQQVLNNLISNAIKFSAPDSATEVTLGREGKHVFVSVRDHGPGIPSDEQANLFQPFARTSVQATGGETSTGLGLAIARCIVEAHRGRIELDSRIGEGSTFRVLLPIERSTKN